MSDDGELARRVGHALRTPLGVIGGALDQLRDRLAADVDALRTFELAGRGIAQIVRIADRLSLLAAVERGLEPMSAPTELRGLVTAALDEIGRTRRRKAIEVVFDEAGATTPVVCDPALARAAIAELVDNAVRFARARVTVALDDDGRTVVIRDDGPGLAPAVLAAAIASRVDDERAGLGIGLWIAGRIAQAHNGSIVAEGASTDGTVLRLRFG